MYSEKFSISSLLISFFRLFRSFHDKSYPVPGNLRALDCIPIDKKHSILY